jgi:hypothetical protein
MCTFDKTKTKHKMENQLLEAFLFCSAPIVGMLLVAIVIDKLANLITKK